MNKIKIKTKTNAYQVIISKNISEFISHEIAGKKIFFVIDKKVYKYHHKKIEVILNSVKNNSKVFYLDSSEKRKSLSTIKEILTDLVAHNFQRDSLIVAVGGGIVGDIAGFAAAIFMRGISYIQIPTTLLAAVDSSVGGKTGINFNHTKNIIGAFHQPQLVLTDTTFFNTLPDEELICGVGEIVKYAFISTPAFFDFVFENLKKIIALDYLIIDKVVAESVRIKAGVVKADEKEEALRKILNFGHTFAHAFEIGTNHKLKHGQAVILGIVCALYLSRNKKLINKVEFDKSLDLLSNFKNKIRCEIPDLNRIIKIMYRDKKNRVGKIKFVLIKSIGEILIDVDASDLEIKKSIKSAFEFFGLK